MTIVEDIVEATKVIAGDSEISGPNDGRVRTFNLKEVDPSAAATATALISGEQIVEIEAVVETIFCEDKELDGDLDCHEKETSSVNDGNGNEMDVDHGSLNGVDGMGVSEDQKSDESNRECVDMDLDGDEKREVNGYKMEGQDHGFLVGDFIWGKIKSHPWWPGQVYDPTDASEFAVKLGQEGRILVAFFGDGSWSWCMPSQLIPFVENFEVMSKDSSSKSFLYAVKRALDEVGRLVESEMTCNCIPKGVKDRLARPVMENAGVKEGVFVPEVNVHRLFLNQHEPAEIVTKLRTFAEAVSSDNEIELMVLTSWLSAFYRFKDGYPLLPYCEPLPVEGLEDKNENIDAVTNDFSVPIAVPILGPLDDDWLSSPPAGSSKAEAYSDDKIYHRRKQKSVAELMRENTYFRSKIHKRSMDSEVGKSESSQKQRKTNDSIGNGSQRASSVGKPRRKRKVELSVSPRIRSKKVHGSENGSGGSVNYANEGGPLVGKPENAETSASEDNSGEAKEESEVITTPRERKKSKYLSPPYTNLELRVGHLGSKIETEIKSNKVTKITHVGEHMVETAGDLFASPPVSDFADKLSSEEKMHNREIDSVDMSVNTEIPTAESDKMIISVSDVNAPVNALLSEIQFAALDPRYLSKGGSFDMVWHFVSALRSSTFIQGSNYENHKKFETGQKRKSLSTQLGSMENEFSMKNTKLADLKPCNEVTQKTAENTGTSNLEKATEIYAGVVAAEKVEEKAPTRLILTFASEFPLPSRNDIVDIFSEFGRLNEKETDVVTDSRAVHIVYMKDTDAVAAFRSSVNQSPFGPGNVNYRLQHSSARSISHGSRSNPSRRKQTPGKADEMYDLMSDVGVIKQKLDIMTAILENYHSKFLPKDKSSLKDEMKHLMQKVEKVSEKVRIMAEKAASSS